MRLRPLVVQRRAVEVWSGREEGSDDASQLRATLSRNTVTEGRSHEGARLRMEMAAVCEDRAVEGGEDAWRTTAVMNSGCGCDGDSATGGRARWRGQGTLKSNSERGTSREFMAAGRRRDGCNSKWGKVVVVGGGQRLPGREERRT
ncbi:hypothetical protein SESBI_15751, partial [Sesbania bispinosa]